MAKGFIYRRIDPDIKEATLIRDLLEKYAGERIEELSKARDFKAIRELAGIQQRWFDLVEDLNTEAELDGGPIDAASPVAIEHPTVESPRRTTRRGGDADKIDPNV